MQKKHIEHFFFCKCTTAAEVDDRITHLKRESGQHGAELSKANISAPYLT